MNNALFKPPKIAPTNGRRLLGDRYPFQSQSQNRSIGEANQGRLRQAPCQKLTADVFRYRFRVPKNVCLNGSIVDQMSGIKELTEHSIGRGVAHQTARPIEE